MSGETLGDRFRRVHADLGPLRFWVLLLTIGVILAKIILYFAIGEPNRILHALAAVVTMLWSADRFLDRHEPDRMWGSVLAVGAILLWAQVFGLIAYPIQGVF